MNAREVTRIMMVFEAQKCIDSLEALSEIARGLDYEDVAKKTRVSTGAHRGRSNGTSHSGAVFGGQR